MPRKSPEFNGEDAKEISRVHRRRCQGNLPSSPQKMPNMRLLNRTWTLEAKMQDFWPSPTAAHHAFSDFTCIGSNASNVILRNVKCAAGYKRRLFVLKWHQIRNNTAGMLRFCKLFLRQM
jgi:hypothetical protein